jgi:hypothetical protein
MYRAREDCMTIYRWAAVAALLTIIVALAFPAISGIGACGKSGSWVAFQMVASVAEVNAMIRPDCANAFVPALRKSMWLDSLAFIPVYAAFLGLVLYTLKPMPRIAWLLGITVLTIGVVADQVEGFRLLAILDALPGTEAMIVNANAATLAKKLGLSLATLVIGLLLIRERSAVRLFGGVTAVGGLAVVLASVGVSFGAHEQLISKFGLLIAWLVLAIVAGLKAFLPARVA